MSLKSDSRPLSYVQITIFKVAAVHHLEFLKIFILGRMIVTEFQICCCVPNFIEIGRWRFSDFQDSGCPPS